MIGRGAYSKVFVAYDDREHKVAVKQLLDTAASSESAALPGGTDAGALRDELVREIAIMRTLKHENVVRYFGTHKTGSELYIVMEYVNGGSLTEYVKNRRPQGLHPPHAAKLMRQLLEGLAYIHEAGVLHRDLKGANILVAAEPAAADAAVDDAADERLKIADFGSSRLLQNGSTLEGDVRTLRGTPFWMAPEVIRGEAYGRRADVWSAGCCLLEMLTGAPPWAGALSDRSSNSFAIMFAIASATAPPPLPPELPPPCRACLLRSLAIDAAARPTAAGLLRTLLGDQT